MEDIGAVGAVEGKGISAAACRLINTKKVDFKVYNKTDKCIYNMKKLGDISTLSSGDKVKPLEEAVLSSRGLHTASGVVTFRSVGATCQCPRVTCQVSRVQDREGDAGAGHRVVRDPGRQR